MLSSKVRNKAICPLSLLLLDTVLEVLSDIIVKYKYSIYIKPRKMPILESGCLGSGGGLDQEEGLPRGRREFGGFRVMDMSLSWLW